MKLPPRHVCRNVADPPRPPGTKVVKVFFLCPDFDYGHYVVAVTRHVPSDAEPLPAALAELLKGPTGAEREAGLFANFTAAETGDKLRGARVEGRRAIVDFHRDLENMPVVNNVTTTSGGGGFFLPIEATVFQFPEVHELEEQFDGDAHAFWSWTERADVVVHRRPRPTAPVPVDADGAIAAASYVGPALERFAGAPWFPLVRFVYPTGDALRVRVGADRHGAPARAAADIASAVADVVLASGSFCDVTSVTVGADSGDRDLAKVELRDRPPCSTHH